MNIQYIKDLGHYIKYEDFYIFFSNRFYDLELMKKAGEISLPEIKISVSEIAFCDQVHSRKFWILDKEEGGSGFIKPEIEGIDALITNDENIIPMVKSADCTPVIIIDLQNGVRAAIHSGREGTKKNIVGETVRGMCDNLGSKSENLVAFVGPSIGVENYEVSEEIFRNFINATGIEQQLFRKLDINKVIVHQLIKSGIDISKIYEIKADTFTNEDYYSYRKDGSQGRQVSLAAREKIK